MSRSVVILVLASANALAQGTWNDLKFGTSVNEVRGSLSKRGLSLVQGDEGWQVKPGWDLKTPGVKIAFHFSPNLLFSNANKLERITLSLQSKQHAAEGVDAPVLTSVAAKSIHEQLVGKYGVPVSKTGRCDEVSSGQLIGGSGQVECKAVWKAAGQTITLNWSYFEQSLGVGKLFFSITYLPTLSSGL